MSCMYKNQKKTFCNKDTWTTETKFFWKYVNCIFCLEKYKLK